MHGNQWVLKIAVLKYYSVSKRGTTAKSNPKQATDPISLHTKFGDNSSNTFPLNERKPCVTPDIGRRTPDIGHRTSDGEKSKNNISTPQGGGHNSSRRHTLSVSRQRRNKWRLRRGDTTFCVEEGMLQGRHTSSHPRLRLDDKYTEILQNWL